MTSVGGFGGSAARNVRLCPARLLLPVEVDHRLELRAPEQPALWEGRRGRGQAGRVNDLCNERRIGTNRQQGNFGRERTCAVPRTKSSSFASGQPMGLRRSIRPYTCSVRASDARPMFGRCRLDECDIARRLGTGSARRSRQGRCRRTGR